MQTCSSHQRSMFLDSRARQMRCAPTRSEEILARALAGKRLGVSFRRQVVLGGRFIADFVAPRAKLVVEVDGRYHARCAVADARRDRVLARLGYRVLRLDAALAETNLDEALALIRAALRRA